VIARPKQPTDRVVIYVHGAGEDAASTLTVTARAATITALVDAGYAVAGSDAHGNNWGAPASVKDYLALARRLGAEGLTRVYVLAQSMGGLAGLKLLAAIRPVAWAGIFPVCNLRSLYGGQYVHEIRAAYGPGLIAALTADSPIVPVGVRGLRMIFWASPADKVVSKVENTDRCAASARAGGARVQVVTTRGDHGDPSNYQPARLVAFFHG